MDVVALQQANVFTKGKVPFRVVKSGNTADLIAKLAAAGAAGGGVVFVPAGLYIVAATLFVPTGVTLAGEGEKTVIKLANGSTTVNPIVAVGSVGGAVVSDVQIRNIKVDGNKANQSTLCIGIDVITGLRVLVTGCHVDAANGYNFHASVGAFEVTFDGNVSTNSFKEGFEAEGASRVKFVNNTVENAGYNGIYVWADTGSGSSCKDVVVANNTVRNYGAGTGAHGIWIDDGAQNVVVSGNTVSDGLTAGGTGIVVGSATAAAVKNVAVTGNTVSASPADGIRVSGAANRVTLTGNMVNGSGANGIEITGSGVDEVLVTGNMVDGSTAAGIYANSAAAGVSIVGNRAANNTGSGILLNQILGASVVGNTCSTNNGSGIRLDPSSASPASGQVLISSNRCINNGTDGIYVKDNNDVSIYSNYCANNGRTTTNRGGITLQASFAPVDSLFVRGNRCTDTRSGGAKTQFYGVTAFNTLTFSSNIVIAENDLRGNATNDAGSGGIQGSSNHDSVAFHRLASQTIGTTQVAVAHGMPYAPLTVSVAMTSAGQIWQSAAADTTNIYLTADAAGRTATITVG